MRRSALGLVCAVAFVILLGVVYRPVWFEDGQFVGGNVSYYFYPLYLRVQQEWEAGRWPLWDPGHNGGEPLLGDPIAAVLYPGKAIYAGLPYAWAARLYLIGHTALAFFGLLALARSCGVSWAGAFLGGLSYAFGAPILLQYSNPNLQVGAGWTPWGLCAIDRLLRQGRRRGLAELAAVLALQVLGGDPESAYLTAVCGAGYALVLTLRARDRPDRRVRLTGSAVAVGVVGVWVGATLVLASAPIGRPGFLATSGLVLAGWAAGFVGIAWQGFRRPGAARLAAMLARLASASALALALSAAQVLPVLEFIGQSWRAVGITSTDLYRFSLDPWRVVELVWPNVFGTTAPENRSWLQAIPPVGGHEVWVDSLYMGGWALVLALSAAGWRGGPPWRAWLTTVSVVAMAASLGKYGSPLWWIRWGPFLSTFGPHDPLYGEPRGDGFLSDGAGSPYGLLCLLLPGFGALRYPSKCLTFAAVALAVLVGAGWDRATEGSDAGTESGWGSKRRLRRLSLAGLGLSLGGLLGALAGRGPAVAYLAGRIPAHAMFGPADPAGAWNETVWALAHGAILFAAVPVVVHRAARRRRGAAALALALLTADLAMANARVIRTVPQAEFDTPPEAARLIETAERSDPSPAPGPFRVHRMSGGWLPLRFLTTHSARRFRELTAWSSQTLYPLVALPLGLEYCTTIGSLELEDYLAFFHPQRIRASARVARVLGVPPGQPVVYLPRRSFDLWGARYFLLPAFPDWTSAERGFASLMDRTELIYPGQDVLYETQSTAERPPWAIRQDWQLRRNQAAYPRAWIVHAARIRSPAADPETRLRWTGNLAYMNDPIWSERDRPVLDLRQTALIETPDAERLKGFLARGSGGPAESVTVTGYQPQRVELKATLDRPGLVILADVYYPGWHLTIDGQPAPILRANRMMRGAAVPSGEHTLIYTYDPSSFRVGGIVSGVGLIVLVGLVLAWPGSFRREPATVPPGPRAGDREAGEMLGSPGSEVPGRPGPALRASPPGVASSRWPTFGMGRFRSGPGHPARG